MMHHSKSQLIRKICLHGPVTLVLFLLLSSSTYAFERVSRLGLGFSSQMKNDTPSLSFKLQKNKSFAFGGLIGYSSDDNGGGYAAALKIYRNIFEEPHLTFFGSVLGGIVSSDNAGTTESGFQADLTLGSEFSFQGLESLGFSLEFGVSFSKLDDFVMETVGNNFVVSAVHFYL